jgi:NADPH-dependent 2,4-dienoyl-CoA reductase/sulfur reductase-like enzyme
VTSRRLVVVGASLAGLRAVEAARKSGFDGPITLIGAEPHPPYDRPPLSKAFLQDGKGTFFRDEQVLREDVDLRLGEPATALDTVAREVRTSGGRYPYDALVIATGARATALPGCDLLDGVHLLRGLDDARAVRGTLDSARRVVVIGAGFIGSEVASSARERGVNVTVVEAQPTPLVRAVGDVMGKACASLHTRNGTDLRCGTGVDALEGNGRVERVRLTDGAVLHADAVVVGIGAVPATEWLRGSGLRLDDGVVCDEYLHTGVPGVYAAGDVARWHNPTFDRPMRLEHWTSAAEQGATAARNALDPANAKPYATVPYFWSDWYGSRFQFVGIPATDEISIVDGEPDGDAFIALYREADRLAGCLTLNRPRDVMKYRRLISTATSWHDAIDFARARHAP